MLQALRPVLSLLCGVALLLLGAGLLNTLIPLRGSGMGFSDALLGGLTSAYFLGFFLGTFAAPPLVRRIGHIRAFAFYAACSACAVLLHSLSGNALLWLGLRFAIGAAFVGLYTVNESWLNAQAEPRLRGQVFATYMAVNLGSLAVAQQLLRAESEAQFALFTLVALLICAATMPVLLTRQAQPSLQPTPRLQLKALFAAAPTAGAGALLSGLAMGAFWGLAPAYALHQGLGTAAVGSYMSVAILGGALLQWPLGRFSDRRDRRLALALVSAMACLIAVAAPLLADIRGLPYVTIFLYGGAAFAVYPIVVAHLLDHLSPAHILSASSSVLLLNGIGAAVGPLLAGAAMSAVTPTALFVWFAVTHGCLALYAAYRHRGIRRVGPAAPQFHPMLRTTPAALQMLKPDAGGSPPAAGERAHEPGRP